MDLIILVQVADGVDIDGADLLGAVYSNLAKYGEIGTQIKVRIDTAGVSAKAAGHKGGKKGGAARAAKLSPERRAEISRKAALTRWSRNQGKI